MFSTPTLDDGRRSRPTSAPVLPWALVAIAVAVAGYFLFAPSILRVGAAYTRPEFSHGYIIPLISLWLIWQRRDLIWELRARGNAAGWLFVAGGAAIALFAKAANIDSLPYLGIMPTLFGFVLVTLGWQSAKLTAVPIGFLVFGFPLPDTSYVQVSTTLQLYSSQIGAAVLKALDIPVFLDGNIIDLGTFKLQVAEACSGLRYLLPLLSFGILCAYMYRAPLWAKALVILMTVPLTVVLNGARIAMTGLIIEFGNQEMAEGFMHLFEGWVVFLIALACLFGFMWLLLRLLGSRVGFTGMLDFDRMAGMPNGHRPQRPAGAAPLTTVAPAVLPSPLLATAVTFAAAALLLVPLHQRTHVIPERPGLYNYPMQINSWRGEPELIELAVERTLATDDYLLADFVDQASGDMVNLWVAYYGSLLQSGSQVHLPTTCLPGAGWEYTELGRHHPGTVDLSGTPLTVNRGVIVHGTQRMVMYFWLELRGHHAVGQEARLMNLRDSLVDGRSDGALVRIYTPLAPHEEPSDGDARLTRFLESSYPHLSPHLGA